MKSKNLGILSAIMASVCCLGPLVLITLGLGGLGIAAIIGKFHWLLIGGGFLLLILGWQSYFSEKKSCKKQSCEFKGKTITFSVLILATFAVTTFASMNLYTQFKSDAGPLVIDGGSQLTVPVDGMTCITCEIAVEKAVSGLEGIYSVDANVKSGNAHVSYDANKVKPSQIIEAINTTGFKAKEVEVHRAT